jgi:hypothetical protein
MAAGKGRLMIPSTNPFSEGWREVRRDAQGVAIGRLRPEEERHACAKKFAADMKRYEARTKASEEERLARAAGIREQAPPDPAKPFDELDLILQQIRSEPHLLNGRGPLGDQLRTDTPEAKRARQHAYLDDYLGVTDGEADEILAQHDPDEDETWEEHLGWLNLEKSEDE